MDPPPLGGKPILNSQLMAPLANLIINEPFDGEGFVISSRSLLCPLFYKNIHPGSKSSKIENKLKTIPASEFIAQGKEN